MSALTCTGTFFELELEAPAASATDACALGEGALEDGAGLEVAGPAFAEPKISVSASSSVWAQTLQLMAEAIVARLNARLGGGTIERAVFRHAGWEDGSQRGHASA